MGAAVLASIMMTAGLVAVIMAYELLGNPKAEKSGKRIRTAHRIVGYVFVIIFAVLMAGMCLRFKEAESFSSRTSIHAAFALLVAALLILKLLIARRYKKFIPYLFFVGGLIFVLSFAFVLLEIGALAGEGAEYARIEPKQDAGSSEETFPPKLTSTEKTFVSKCGQCHPIGQVIRSLRNTAKAEDWPEIVERMKKKTNTISDENARQITLYLQHFYE